jgi:hypothetical protein
MIGDRKLRRQRGKVAQTLTVRASFSFLFRYQAKKLTAQTSEISGLRS